MFNPIIYILNILLTTNNYLLDNGDKILIVTDNLSFMFSNYH